MWTIFLDSWTMRGACTHQACTYSCHTHIRAVTATPNTMPVPQPYSSHSSTTKYNREWYKLKVQSSTYVYVLPSGSMNVCFLCAARSYAAFS